MFHEFVPKSWIYLQEYRWELFKKDALAGITVGIVALPLAMAFAIASGVSPDKGIFTAIVAGFLISALGGSSVQIGGPTGAFVVIVYDVLQRTGYPGLALATFFAGIFLLFFGLFRIGSWIKYVPYSLITGFTTAIAVLIFSSQIKEFFGLSIKNPSASFMGQWMEYIRSMPSIRPETAAIGFGTLFLICALRRFCPRIPWGVASILIATSITSLFHIPVETIYSKFSSLPSSLPFPSFPSMHVSLDQWPEVIRDSFAIAFLGAIESLLSAVVADGMLGTRHKSNCELMAQGIANIGSVLFGGIPATGAIARTATNVKSGGRTPVAGMIHALTLLFILMYLSPWVNKIPLASLSAILMVVAWNMSEMPHFLRLIRSPTSDTVILLTAFILTLFVDITVAIMVGMVIASFLFMKNISVRCKAVAVTTGDVQTEFPEQDDPEATQNKSIPFGVEVYEIQGPFFFGSTDILQNLIPNLAPFPKVFILRMRQVPLIDVSGVNALKEFYSQCQKHKIVLLLSGVHGHLKRDLEKLGFIRCIGADRVFPNIDAALAKVHQFLV